MSEVTIKDVGKIFFVTKEEAASLPDEERYNYDLLFPYIEKIADELMIATPDLALTNKMRQYNPDADYYSETSAMTFTPKDHPQLKNNLLFLSLEHSENAYLSGVIAHELRHLWQDRYKPELRVTRAVGYLDSLYDEAEIDADGYAIAHLSRMPGMYPDKAGGIICKYEKRHNKKAYAKRIERAKEIPTEMDAFWEDQRKKQAEKSAQKISPASRLWRKIFGGRG